jgi:hypothetical protein
MSKKNLILGGVLIVLVAFAWIWSGPLQDWKKTKQTEKSFLAEVSLAKINKIIIDKNGQRTELDKNADTWTINGVKNFGVDKTAAGALNSALSEIGSLPLETVSANADKKISFGTDEKGVKVEIEQDGATFDLVIGKGTPDYAGTYIAQPDFGKTCQIALDLNSLLGRDDWRDLTIFSFLKERASKVRFQYPSQQFIVEKINNKWAGTQPKKFDVTDDKVNAALSVLGNLTAAKIPAQSFANTGLENIHSRIIIQTAGDGFDNTLFIGDCTKDNFCYAKTAANDNIYLISKADRDSLNKKMTDLK